MMMIVLLIIRLDYTRFSECKNSNFSIKIAFFFLWKFIGWNNGNLYSNTLQLSEQQYVFASSLQSINKCCFSHWFYLLCLRTIGQSWKIFHLCVYNIVSTYRVLLFLFSLWISLVSVPLRLQATVFVDFRLPTNFFFFLSMLFYFILLYILLFFFSWTLKRWFVYNNRQYWRKTTCSKNLKWFSSLMD